MIPQTLIETGHGISVITVMLITFGGAYVSYIFKEFFKFKRDTSTTFKDMGKCKNHMDKRIALLEQRDATFKESMKEIKDNLSKIFNKIDDLSIEVAKMNGKNEPRK